MKSESHYRKIKIAVYAVAFCLSIWMITSTCFAYIVQSYPEMSLTQLQQLLTAYALVSIVVSLIMGPLSIKVSKKVLMNIGLCLLFTACMIYAFVGSKSYVLLYIGGMIYGMSAGITGVMLNSIIAEALPPETRADAMAKYSVFSQIGAIIYNILGGWIAAQNSGANWQRVYFLGVFIIPVLILFNLALPNSNQVSQPDSQTEQVPATQSAGKDKFPIYAVLMLVHLMVYVMFFYTFQLNISNYYVNVLMLGDTTQCGYITSGLTVGMVLSGAIYKYTASVFKNWGPCFGMSLCALGLLLISVGNHLFVFVLGAFLIGFGNMYVTPFVASRLSMVVSSKFVPIAMSLYLVSANVAIYLNPYCINGLASLFVSSSDSLALMKMQFLVGSVGAVFCVVLGIFLYPLYMKKHPDNMQ